MNAALAAGQDAPRPARILWTYVGAAAFFAAMGLLFVGLSLSQFVKDSALEARGQRTTATVDSLDITHSSKGGPTSYLDVHFRLPDEKHITTKIVYDGNATSDFGIDPDVLFSDTTVPVVYDPQDPMNAQLPGGYSSTRDAAFVVAGLIVAVVAFAYAARALLWVRRVRRLPRIVASEPMKLTVERVGSGRSARWLGSVSPAAGCTIDALERFSLLSGQRLRSRFGDHSSTDAQVYAGPEDRMFLVDSPQGYVWPAPRFLWPLRHVRREHIASFAAAETPEHRRAAPRKLAQTDTQRHARSALLASWYDAPPVADAAAVITAYEAVLASQTGHRVSPKSLLPHPDTSIAQAILSLLNARAEPSTTDAAAAPLSVERRRVLQAELVELASFVDDADAELVANAERGQVDDASRERANAILERVQHAEAEVIDSQLSGESLAPGGSILADHPIAIGATDEIVNGLAFWSDATAVFSVGVFLYIVLIIVRALIGGLGVAGWIVLIAGALLWVLPFMLGARILLRITQRHEAMLRYQIPFLCALALAIIGATAWAASLA